MESGRPLASSPEPFFLHMASSKASSSPAPPQKLHTNRFSDSYNCLLCSPGHSLRIMEDECVNMSVSPNGLNLANSPVVLNASSSSCSEFGGLGCLGLSALAAPSQLGTFPDWWRTSETQTRAAAAFFPPLLGLHPFVLSTFKSHDPVDFQSRPSGKRSLSLGVNGTVNGRSASSPAGNAPAMNTSSLLAKGKKETPQANSHEPGQLHQKPLIAVYSTPCKLTLKPNKRPLETSSMSGSQSESQSESSSEVEESSSDPDDMEEEDDDDQSSDSEESGYEKQSPAKQKVKVSASLELLCKQCVYRISELFSLHISSSNMFLNLYPNGAINGAVQDAPLALITKPRIQSSTPNSKPLLAATSPPCSMPINLSTGTKEMLDSSASPLKTSASSEPRSRKTTQTVHSGRSLTRTNTSCLPVDLVRGSEPDIHSSKNSDDSLGDDYDDDEDEDSGSSFSVQWSSWELLGHRLHCEWQRETRIRTVAGRLQGEVAYFAPCGKKLRQYPDVVKYLIRNGITEISRDNFSFSTKIKVGDFYEAREGPEGLQWFLLAEDEIAPSIIAMDGRRSRRTKSEHQPTGDSTGAIQWKPYPLNGGENNFQDVSDAKLLRKLEAQEIARQAAQIKMMRKLEKQAIAQAAKEAKKQQAIMAAEERRKKREQLKILKQQEKIKRIQQIRMEKELRAQQILEVCPESYCRNILKHFLSAVDRIYRKKKKERERRRQHMILMKAVEARKKAEVRRMSETRKLNKERKLELRRLELEKAKELKKPNEDMCLADHKPLPELSRIPGLVLAGSTFSNCLMVLQFLHSFGKVLGLDLNSDPLTIGDLQEGLLNIGENMEKVQDLLVTMLSAAVCDPGVPAGHKSKTILGDHLTNVEINRDNVSEILQIYMEGHSEQKEVAMLAFSLRTKPFQAHSPSQKASVLAFLVNELCCSKAVISVQNKSKRKEGDSEEEEDEDDDSEDQRDDEEEEEEEAGGKRGKKTDICEEEVSGNKMLLT
uniref:Bromodomain adjacent to zinc finger domain 2B n=1 Tax=Pundamilia nyererei TaxID=303518 RepID=A0A3B4EYS2_9CICH